MNFSKKDYKNWGKLLQCVLFETEEDAQRILDERYPGATVKLFDNNDFEITNQKGKKYLFTNPNNELTFTELFDDTMKDIFGNA